MNGKTQNKSDAISPALDAQWQVSVRPKLELYCLAFCLLTGALQNYTGRMSFYTDGVHYLDFANAWRSGDWWLAVDTFRSPLYSWIAAAWLNIFQPSMDQLLASLHVLNFIIFALVTLCFRFCLREHIATVEQRQQVDGLWRIDPQSWLLLGYSLYFLASIKLTPSHQHAPDMMVMGGCFLATGLDRK